jgi:hypothetical protein
MSKVARVWLALFACLFALAAEAQVAVISGQAIDQNGRPLPNALVRVCPVTSTGVPCTPLAAVFQDYGLSIPATNPWTTDQYGNYTLFVGSTAPPDLYTVQQSPVSGVTWSYVQNGPFLGGGGGTLYGALYAPDINGVIFPAACGWSPSPTWCSGTTADAWIRAACSQLPDNGGTLDFTGLTGVLAASVPCSTPTKQVNFKADVTTNLIVTENDGGTTFPIDNSSTFVGPGKGQCVLGNGIHLDPTANVAGIVGNAHTDGTQEDFTAQGLCLWGATGATVTKGLIYASSVYTNTTVEGNNLQECNHNCILLENDGGQINVGDNEANVTDGNYNVFGTPIEVWAHGVNGCGLSAVNIHGGNAEHANGGASNPEMWIHGDGAGALVCGVWVHDYYFEKNLAGTPDTTGIRVSDCYGCKIENVQFGGGTGLGNIGDAINISQTALGRDQNIMVNQVTSVFNSYLNTINDTTPGGKVLAAVTNNFVSNYIAQPGYQILPPLPQNTIESCLAI